MTHPPHVPFLLHIATQIPDVLMTLTEALDSTSDDPAAAARATAATKAWKAAEPETRAGILLSAAWGARSGAPVVPKGDSADIVSGYVEDFHRYATAFSDDGAEAFHGTGFPAMPLPGQAGALASSLAFDRDDLPISLRVALVLLVASRGGPRGR